MRSATRPLPARSTGRSPVNIQAFTFAGPTRGRRGLTGRGSAGLSPAMSRSLPPSILDPSTLGLAVVTLLAACSATSPPSQYPPPGPSGGLPYIPFPKKSIFDEGIGPSESAEQPAAAAKPSVISGDLPDKPPAALSRKASCTDKVCTLKTWLPDPTFAQERRRRQARADSALAGEHQEGQHGRAAPATTTSTCSAVDARGPVIANSDDGKEVRNLDVWSALRVPGAGCTLRANERREGRPGDRNRRTDARRGAGGRQGQALESALAQAPGKDRVGRSRQGQGSVPGAAAPSTRAWLSAAPAKCASAPASSS